MKKVETIIENGKLYVSSDYNAEWVKRAKLIGGKWDGSRKCWRFGVDDAGTVSDALLDIFGDDGSDEPAKVADIFVRVDKLYDDTEITICGVPICRRMQRDDPVRMADGVVLVRGAFGESGGSAKHPRVCAMEDTVVKIKNVPERLIDKMLRDDKIKDAIEHVEHDHPVQPEEPEEPDTLKRVDQLRKERDELVKRIAEIDEEISKMILIV